MQKQISVKFKGTTLTEMFSKTSKSKKIFIEVFFIFHNIIFFYCFYVYVLIIGYVKLNCILKIC